MLQLYMNNINNHYSNSLSEFILQIQHAAQCTQGAIRLQGGTANSGRVEICNSNRWGTVCDDFWGTVDAQVACRQLGFTATGEHL